MFIAGRVVSKYLMRLLRRRKRSSSTTTGTNSSRACGSTPSDWDRRWSAGASPSRGFVPPRSCPPRGGPVPRAGTRSTLPGEVRGLSSVAAKHQGRRRACRRSREGYLVAGLDPRRTVVTCHDLILIVLASGRIGGSRVPLVALQIFRISLELMKRAAIVVADSTQTKRDLVHFTHIDPAKVIVIHPGLNQSFAPEPEDKPALATALRVRVQAASFCRWGGLYKNLPCVLRVLHRLRQRRHRRLCRARRSRRWPDGEGGRGAAGRGCSHIVELGSVAGRGSAGALQRRRCAAVSVAV